MPKSNEFIVLYILALFKTNVWLIGLDTYETSTIWFRPHFGRHLGCRQGRQGPPFWTQLRGYSSGKNWRIPGLFCVHNPGLSLNSHWPSKFYWFVYDSNRVLTRFYDDLMLNSKNELCEGEIQILFREKKIKKSWRSDLIFGMRIKKDAI